MRNKNWIGAALSLALCTTALASCSRSDQPPAQPNAQEADAGLQWTRDAEKELLEAIAGAPAHGLKSDLFLKGELPKDDAQRFQVLTRAALGYAEALAHGYVDPRTIAKDYTIPRPEADVRAGLWQAIQSGNVGEWLASLAPQTDEYRALSAALTHYSGLVAAAKGPQASDGANDAALRVRQLAVALERLRWLERSPPATRIDVNTAAAFLDYWRGGRPVDRRNVITGEPDGWETPQLQAPIFQLVANPKWRVPDRVAADELAEKGSAWFAENDISTENGRYVQQSGPKNSLGLVKFDMDDKQQIYLHDTPYKTWFSRPKRHRSHGCVRVDGALDFAAMLAGQDGVLPKFQEAMASEDETFVKLKTSIPVRLLYHTAFLDGGRVVFAPDVYGWDDDVARALGLERGPPRAAFKRQKGDVGP